MNKDAGEHRRIHLTPGTV